MGTNAEGYFWYMAPEVESKGEHSQKSDIWNLGCVYLSLLSGKLVENSGTLLCKVSNEELKFKIRSQLKSFHELFQRLILDCLNKNPKLRPTADEVVDKIKHIKSTLGKELANVIMAFSKTTEIEEKKKEIYAAVKNGDFNKATMLIAEIKKIKKNQSFDLEMEIEKKTKEIQAAYKNQDFAKLAKLTAAITKMKEDQSSNLGNNQTEDAAEKNEKLTVDLNKAIEEAEQLKQVINNKASEMKKLRDETISLRAKINQLDTGIKNANKQTKEAEEKNKELTMELHK